MKRTLALVALALLLVAAVPAAAPAEPAPLVDDPHPLTPAPELANVSDAGEHAAPAVPAGGDCDG